MKLFRFNILYWQFIFTLFLIYCVSCSEEFDLFNDDLKLTANYEEVVAVYANICPQNDTNYLRINRGFAVDNFFAVNSNPDSLYFNPNDIQVFAHKINGDDTIITYTCHDTLVDKDTVGDFPTDLVLLYYFNSNNLLNANDQDIDFAFTIKTENKKVTSRTNLLQSVLPVNPYISFLNFSSSGFRYSVYSFSGTQKIQVRGICSFYERRLNDNIYDTIEITFDFPVGNNNYADPIASDYYRHDYLVSIGAFIYYLEKAINSHGDLINTTKRWMGKVQFEMLCANADFALFESFDNSITTGFSEEPITYSNIVNGVGYLTSYSKSYSNKLLFTRVARDTILNRMFYYHFE